MSQLQKELEKLEKQLKSLPSSMVDARVNVANVAEISAELSNLTNLNGLANPYYETIKKYGRQRAIIIENSTARLDPYNINPSSDWTGITTSFTFPTDTSFIFYSFDDTGNPIVFDPLTMYFIEDGSGNLASRYAITEFLKSYDDQIKPSFSVSTVTVNSVDHDKATFDTNLSKIPDLREEFALMDSSTGDNIGYVVVGIEGLGIDPSWDVFQSVDLDNQTQVDNWIAAMMFLTNPLFSDLTGGYSDGSITEDDVLRSANPDIKSIGSPPYTKARLENSPFFPALNTDESDWPSNFESIDYTNRKLVVDGTPKWAVYPKFRWENRLIPTSLSSDVNSEELPGTFYGTEHLDGIIALNVNQTDFPENTTVGDIQTTYFWLESSDKIFESVDDVSNPDPPIVSEYPCTYNSITDIISYYDTNLDAFLNLIVSDWNGFTNTVDVPQQANDSNFVGVVVQGLIDKMNAVKAHHDSWFDSSDNGVTSVFNNDIGTYNQSFINDFRSHSMSNSTAFDDRETELMDKIGSVSGSSGYVVEVIKAANLIVHRNYGIVYNQYKQINNLDSITDLAVQIRRKYDAYS